MIKRALKLEVLEFIREKEIITALDLMNRFGYSRGGADWRLYSLKMQNLIINERRGEYTITDTGLRRLSYYGRLSW